MLLVQLRLECCLLYGLLPVAGIKWRAFKYYIGLIIISPHLLFLLTWQGIHLYQAYY